MGRNVFDVREQMRQQNLKESAAAPEQGPVAVQPAGLELKPRKRKKQTYTVYLDRDLMGRVQRLAERKDVAASAVIEACVKIALEQLEN